MAMTIEAGTIVRLRHDAWDTCAEQYKKFGVMSGSIGVVVSERSSSLLRVRFFSDIDVKGSPWLIGLKDLELVDGQD